MSNNLESSLTPDDAQYTHREVRPALLALGTFATGTDAFLVSGVLPTLAHDLGVSMALAGQAVTVFALTYAIASPVLAVVNSRLDRRTVMVGALVLLAAANAACALAPGIGSLLTARVVAALAAAQYTPNATAVVAARTPPERRGRSLAVLLGGITAGTVLGLPAGTLVGGGAGWRASFWLVAALAAGAATVLAVSLPPVRVAETGWPERLAPLRDPAIALVLATTVLLLVGPYATMTYVAAVTAPVTAGSATTLAVLLGVNGIAATLGSWLAGRFVDRFGPRRVLVVQLGALVVALGTLGVARRSLPATAALLTLWGLAGFGTAVAQQHRLARLAGRATPLVMGLNGSAIYLGSTIGGATGGVVLASSGAATVPLVSAGLVALAFGVVLLPEPEAGRRDSDSDRTGGAVRPSPADRSRG